MPTPTALMLYSRRLQYLSEMHELAAGQLRPHEIAERESLALHELAEAMREAPSEQAAAA